MTKRQERSAESPPSASNEYVPRVAVDEDSIPTSAEIELSPERFKSLVRALQDSPDDPPSALARASSARARGPGYGLITMNQADALELHERVEAFPIRSRLSLAARKPWNARTVRFVFRDDVSDEEILYVELASDLSEYDAYSASGGLHGTFRVDEARRELLSSFCEFERSPARPPFPLAVPAIKFDGDNAVFALPPRFGEYAIRFFSRSLRVHAVAHAALPNGISRPLALNGSFCSVVQGDQRRSRSRRVNFLIHPTSCQCFCRAWRNSPRAHKPIAPVARSVRVSARFCGCALASGMRSCAHHGEVGVRRTANGRLVCVGGMDLCMECVHGPERGQRTTIPLPVTDEFASALAAAAVDLCEDCDRVDDEDADPESSAAATAVAAAATAAAERTFEQLHQESRRSERRFEDELSSMMLTEDELRERDELVVAMLCDGNYCFGKKARQRGEATLFLRDGTLQKNARNRDLLAAARSHAHLLPPA